MCQCRPSASVHSGEKMIWGGGTRATLAIRRSCPRPCSPCTPTPGQRGVNLVTGLAARTQAFGVVAAAVDFASVVEVDEVYQQLAARGAHKTLRVPAGTQTCAAGKHGDVPASNLLPALPDDRDTATNMAGQKGVSQGL